MAGYTKLFSSILASTVWREDADTRLVWITLLAMADKHGVAEGSVPGLADFARVPVENTRRALAKLAAPDPDSRSQEHEGRRIQSVDGGWLLLNHAKYRERLNLDERREYKRLKEAQYRAEASVDTAWTNVDKRGQSWTGVDAVDTKQKQSTEAEASPEAEEGEGADAPAPGLTPLRLGELWHTLTGEAFPDVLSFEQWSKARLRTCRARIKEHPDEGYWTRTIEAINASPFCNGVNDRKWVASFDWLIKPDTATKVLEGKYDRRMVVKL
jgi:hypothetical protein